MYQKLINKQEQLMYANKNCTSTTTMEHLQNDDELRINQSKIRETIIMNDNKISKYVKIEQATIDYHLSDVFHGCSGTENCL